MITVDEALKQVLRHARIRSSERQLAAELVGHVLAEDILADLDLPPFDKALMDGYAVRGAEVASPGVILAISEEIPAGRTPSRPLAPGEAAVIMTGAPVPAGADAVVQHERTTRVDPGRVRIDLEARPGMNILARGRELRAGDLVLREGTKITPALVGLLASVGRKEVSVTSKPRIVVVPTGDELVEPGQVPGPGQIRNSHAVMLGALARALGCPTRVTPIAPDAPEALQATLKGGLDEADVLLVTGGVSAGQRDLVPETLSQLGVTTIFHKIQLKPGKPLLFGVGPARSDADRPPCLVFGLPGNPVSGLVGFHLFVAPAVRVLSGGQPTTLDAMCLAGQLRTPFRHRGDRPTFHPARARATGGCLEVEPLAWAGSADLRAAAHADGFAHFPAGDRDYLPGEPVRFLPMIA